MSRELLLRALDRLIEVPTHAQEADPVAPLIADLRAELAKPEPVLAERARCVAWLAFTPTSIMPSHPGFGDLMRILAGVRSGSAAPTDPRTGAR